jgi:hypothetical protein
MVMKVSGIDECPNVMPMCDKCGDSNGWLVLEDRPGYIRQIMCVNLNESTIHMYGKWNVHSLTKEYVMLHATRMKCATCGKLGNQMDFMRLMTLFWRENLDDGEVR